MEHLNIVWAQKHATSQHLSQSNVSMPGTLKQPQTLAVALYGEMAIKERKKEKKREISEMFEECQVESGLTGTITL